MSEPLFNAQEFALQLRLAMARANVGIRELAREIGYDQANIHRVVKHNKAPSLEGYLRLVPWMEKHDG